MQHSFDIGIAMQYGVYAAILLNNLGYWIKHNEANGTNFHDGKYWTYNSRKAYKELFPYMSERQINTALEKLISDGLVVTGNYNESAYDRTLWYALTQKGKSILHFDKMENDEMSNGLCQNVKPIPNINTNINTNINNILPVSKKTGKKDTAKPSVEQQAASTMHKKYDDIILYLNQKAGTRYRASTPKTQRLLHARLSEGFSLEDFQSVIDKKCAEWNGTEMAQYLRPETLFGTKFESYLNAPARERKTYGANGIEILTPADDELAGIF